MQTQKIGFRFWCLSAWMLQMIEQTPLDLYCRYKHNLTKRYSCKWCFNDGEGDQSLSHHCSAVTWHMIYFIAEKDYKIPGIQSFASSPNQSVASVQFERGRSHAERVCSHQEDTLEGKTIPKSALPKPCQRKASALFPLICHLCVYERLCATIQYMPTYSMSETWLLYYEVTFGSVWRDYVTLLVCFGVGFLGLGMLMLTHQLIH